MSGRAGLVRARAFRRVRRDGDVFVWAPGLEAATRFAPWVASLAEACRGFAAPEVHAQRFAASSGRSVSEALAQLEALAAAGLLRRADEPAAASGPVAPFCIGLPTANRPGRAAKTIRLLAEHLRDAATPAPMLIADGSKNPADAVALARACAETQAATGQATWALPHDLPQRLARWLEGQGFARPAVEFALLDPNHTGIAFGAQRNGLLFAAAGRRLLTVDDDVEVPVLHAPLRHPGARVLSGRGNGYDNYQPHEFWFLAERAAVRQLATRSDESLIGVHDAALGRSGRAALSRFAEPEAIDFDSSANPEHSDLAWSDEGTVRVTFQGAAGDIGWYAPTWYLLFEGASRERLVRDQDTYLRSTTHSREVLRVVERFTVTDGRFSQATVLGLDTRAGFPPFFPLGRYEDGVMRMVLRLISPSALFAHFPSMLLHDPVEVRHFSPELIWQTAAGVRLGETMVQLLLASQPLWGVTEVERTVELGQRLSCLGRLSLDAFENLLRDRFTVQKALFCEHLEGLLDRYGGEPAWWANDVRRFIETTQQGFQKRWWVVPRDLRRPDEPHAAALGRLKQLVADYGALLGIWPAMHAVARDAVASDSLAGVLSEAV